MKVIVPPYGVQLTIHLELRNGKQGFSYSGECDSEGLSSALVNLRGCFYSTKEELVSIARWMIRERAKQYSNRPRLNKPRSRQENAHDAPELPFPHVRPRLKRPPSDER